MGSVFTNQTADPSVVVWFDLVALRALLCLATLDFLLMTLALSLVSEVPYQHLCFLELLPGLWSRFCCVQYKQLQYGLGYRTNTITWDV